MTFKQLHDRQPEPKPWIVLVYCLGDAKNNVDHYERMDPTSAEQAEERYNVVTSWDQCYTASLCFEIIGTDAGHNHREITKEEQDLIPLHSVSTGIGTDGVGYPMYKNGGYDMEAGVHLEDTTEEWFEGLSKKDRATVDQIKEGLI